MLLTMTMMNLTCGDDGVENFCFVGDIIKNSTGRQHIQSVKCSTRDCIIACSDFAGRQNRLLDYEVAEH